MLLIPGLDVGDYSLYRVRTYLRGCGHEVWSSRIACNVGCSEAAVGRLLTRLAEIADRADREVALVGHSRGGLFARVLSQRRPDLVSGVVTLGSPFRDQLAVHPFVWANVETRWTGRPGYPVRTMIGTALVKAVYALPTWTRTARLIAEHDALREVIGGAPSCWACYRFAKKLRKHNAKLTACIAKVLAGLHEANPEMGQTVAIDGSDMPAYANGHKHVGNKNGPLRTRFADPDAGWGHRSSISTRKGGAFYGYKLHIAICTQTELPLAWIVRAANEPEQGEVAGLLDTLTGRGFAPSVCVMDKGYDGQPMHDECESRGIRPVIALTETAAVKAGKAQAPRVRPRHLDVRARRHEAGSDQVAVPDR